MPIASTQVPPVRTFQTDGGAIGNIPNSVNLFRGDVNLSQTLVSLPGRNGLDVSLTLFYGSNVKKSVDTWNVAVPTGIVGLGWALPIEAIVVLNPDAPSPNDHRYALATGADTTALLPNPARWLRLRLTGDMPKATDLVASFAAAGLRLSREHELSEIRPNDAWRITDRDHQRCFQLERDGEGYVIFDGGEGFEVFNYQFWQIRYYAEFERWEITREDGNTSSYGGLSADDAASNALRWRVGWGNWSGSSLLTGDRQHRYPIAWNLRTLHTPWGDEVRYAYDVVEQQVGPGGLSFTKACYIARIEDMFGRALVLNYGEKTYVADRADGPREYLAPHWNDPYTKAPDTAPGAYQDCYETRYLKGVDILNAQGQVISQVAFSYALRNFTDIASDDPLCGDTVKRCLTEIRLITPGQPVLPGLRFEYGATGAINAGGLTTITYPQGGVARFVYQAKSLDICKRDLTIDNPWPGVAVPRVWFGADYAVVMWLNSSSGKVDLRIYSWVGRWQIWQPSAQIPTGSIDLDTIEVSTAASSCVISYHVNQKTTRSLVFRKNDLFWGQWFEYPGNPIDTPSTAVDVVGGNDFFLINNRTDQTLVRYNWSRRNRLWEKQQVLGLGAEKPVNFVVAGESYHAVLTYDRQSPPGKKKNLLQLFYRDRTGAWAQGESRELNFTIAGGEAIDNFHWVAGPSFLVANYTTTRMSNRLDYAVMILGWDRDYRSLSVETRPYSLRLYEGGGQAISPNVVLYGNTMIASGPHLLRYNGETWLANDSLMPTTEPVSGNIFWYAHGVDCALFTQNTPVSVKSRMQYFDPSSDVSSWARPPIDLLNDKSPKSRLRHYFPTVAEGFCSVDQKIYSRGTSTGWARAVTQPFTIPGNIDTLTLANAGPSFMSFLDLPSDGIPLGAEVLPFKNGRVDGGRGEKIAQRFFQPLNSDAKPVAHVDGKLPCGPGSFFTFLPLNKELPYATSITLHRYVDTVLEGMITDYPVRQVIIEDGYQSFSTLYEFDEASAACDPAGDVVKYYKNTVYSGATDKASQPAGRTVQYYMNSLPFELLPVADEHLKTMVGADIGYSLLDGVLYKTLAYDSDGHLVASSVSSWSVETQAIIEGEKRPLEGGYIKMFEQIAVSDGLTVTTRYEYDQESGLEIRQSVRTFDAQGRERDIVRETTYGFMVYDWFRAAHVLNLTVQKRSKTIPIAAPSEEAVLGSAVTVAGPFERPDADGLIRTVYAPIASYDWTGGGGSQEFRWWDGAEPPVDWRLAGRILRRTINGLVCEVVDDEGLVGSTIFDESGQFQIAQFTNASLAGLEASYLGFEPYETGPGWQVDPAQTPYSEDVHTGSRALRLPAGSVGPHGAFRARAGERVLFSCWYKTGVDFVAGDAGWSLAVEGQEIASLILAFAKTDEEWRYLSGVMEIPSGTGSVGLTIAARNSARQPVVIDNLRFSPFLGDFQACVFALQGAQSAIATVGPQAQVSRNLCDGYGTIMAQVGPAENVTVVTQSYTVRPTTEGLFDPAEPNATIAIGVAGDSLVTRFNGGKRWQRDWQANSGWNVEGEALVHGIAAAGRLALTATGFAEDYGVALELLYDAPPASVGFAIGDTITLSWSKERARWDLVDSQGGASLAGRQMTQPGRLLMLVVLPQRIFFFVDGDLIFSYVPAKMPKGAPAITASGSVGIRNLLVFKRPSLVRSFADGAGNKLQTQAWEEESLLIGGALYNRCGQVEAQTRMVRLPQGAADRAFAYRRDFITGLDPVSGVMSGVVSDRRPEDEGYPYGRNLLESSPLNRPVETGQPGKRYAITGAPPAERHTARIARGVNDDTLPAGLALPVGQYAVTLTTDPDGRRSYSIATKTGETVASGQILSDRPGDVIQQAVLVDPDNHGSTSWKCLPNYFDPPAGSRPEEWINRVRQNLLGDILETETPDCGLTRFLYDRQGRRRFTRDAAGTAGNYALYSKYDLLGRVSEEGYIAIDEAGWASLQPRADQPDWPNQAAEPSTHWVKLYEYDGSGEDPDQIGQLTGLHTRGDGLGEPVIETMRYDRRGTVVERTLSVPGDDGRTHRIAYESDGAMRVARIDYGDGFSVAQRYSRTGTIKSIEVTDARGVRDVAHFNFDANELIADMSLPAHGGLKQTWHRNSPGWQTEIENPFFTQTLQYDLPEQSFYTGRPAGLATRMRLPLPPEGFVSDLSYRFAYDTAGRLSAAWSDKDPRWNFAGPDAPAQYDRNGNIIDTRGKGGGALYHYRDGKDQIASTTGDQGPVDYRHDVRGNIVDASDRAMGSIAYDRARNLPAVVEPVAPAVQGWSFAYDGRDQRVLKEGPQGRRLYIRGMQNRPLVERWKASDGTETIQRYVYGPQGLLLIAGDEGDLAVLSDNIGSPRVIVDATGTPVAGFNYKPFGDALGTIYGQPEVLARIRYRFTGQEWEDDLGLYNFQARLYDAAIGRFWAVDPLEQQSSPYAYASNQPLMFVDPDGKEAITLTMIVITVVIGAVMGAGTHAIVTAATHGDFKDGTAWGAAIGTGAVTGLVAMGVGGMIGAAIGTGATSAAGAAAMGAGAGAISGGVAGVVGVAMENGIKGKSFDAREMLFGMLGGMAMGALTGGLARGISYVRYSKVQTPANGGIFTRLRARNPTTVYTALAAAGEIHTTGMGGNVRAAASSRFQEDWFSLTQVQQQQRNGILSVLVHGETNGNYARTGTAGAIDGVPIGGESLSGASLAERIGNAGMQNGSGIELMTCHAGKGSLAWSVATRTGLPVRASPGIVTLDVAPPFMPARARVDATIPWRIYQPMGLFARTMNYFGGFVLL